MPLRWLPYEVVSEDEYSCKSDAYSFGATAWEILTRAEMPFASLTDQEVLSRLESADLTWPHPDSSPEELNTLLDKCWAANPTERPTFSHIALHIADLLAKLGS